MAGGRKMAGAWLSLLVALAAISCCSCSTYEVQDLKDDILHNCRFYINKNLGTWDPPHNSECCRNIRSADVANICEQFTDADKEKIEVSKFVKACRMCEHALPVGSTCAGYRVPPLRQ